MVYFPPFSSFEFHPRNRILSLNLSPFTPFQRFRTSRFSNLGSISKPIFCIEQMCSESENATYMLWSQLYFLRLMLFKVHSQNLSVLAILPGYPGFNLRYLRFYNSFYSLFLRAEFTDQKIWKHMKWRQFL